MNAGLLHTADSRRRRLEWLDFFRGAAVLVMIETHVINTFLAAPLRDGGGFAVLNYLNGLVAPSFLFIAGFVQGMERRTSPGKPINYARRAIRLLGIAALGYALHFPWAELSQHRWAEALRIGTQVDVLQCLAFGLGLLLAVGWFMEKLRARVDRAGSPGEFHSWRDAGVVWPVIVAVCAVAAVLAAPSVQGWMGGPLPLRAWVNGTTGSLFPLFPWVGFVLLGALVGAWPERPVAERTAGLVALGALAWACRGATFSAFSPAFFLERAVWVIALAACCEWAARRPLPGPVVYAGQRSLAFYVAHLLLISALAAAGMPPLGLPGTLALLAAVATASFAAARVCDRWPLFRAPRHRPVMVAQPSPSG